MAGSTTLAGICQEISLFVVADTQSIEVERGYLTPRTTISLRGSRPKGVVLSAHVGFACRENDDRSHSNTSNSDKSNVLKAFHGRSCVTKPHPRHHASHALPASQPKGKGGEQRGGHEIRDVSCLQETLAWQSMIIDRSDAMRPSSVAGPIR